MYQRAKIYQSAVDVPIPNGRKIVQMTIYYIWYYVGSQNDVSPNDVSSNDVSPKAQK
jgi:hypothetical protein